MNATRERRKSIVLLFIHIILANIASSQNPTPSTKYKSVTYKSINSVILNEDRRVFIYQPENTTSSDLPVIYLLDGEKLFFYDQVLEYTNTNPHIIIGIETNKNRSRDMYPFKIEQQPGSGVADAFLEFLVKELMPYVNTNYPTTGKNILIGCSASGTFTLNAMLSNPESFIAYISSSPPVGYNIDYMINKVNNFESTGKLGGRYLYINYGMKGEMPEATKHIPIFSKLLSDRFNNMVIKLEAIEGEGHCPNSSIRRGLEFIYGNKTF